MRLHSAWMKCAAAVALLALLVSPLATAQPASAVLWTLNSPKEIKWVMVTNAGTVVAATDEGLTSYDPETGNVAWTRPIKKVTADQAQDIPGTPLLLVSENEGRFSVKTKLYALNVLTGESLWETERIKGSTVGVFPIYEKDMVLMLTVTSNLANKDKPDMTALNMMSGEVLWESEFTDKVDLHAIEKNGKATGRYDLSGHQPPVHDEDSLYFTFAGLHRYNLNDGKLIWKVAYDVTEGKIKRGNAQVVIDNGVVYTSAKGQLRAFDRATGAPKWTSPDFGGAVAEVQSVGDVLYARMGGSFFDYGKNEWALKKPLGVVAVTKNSGQPIWRFDKAKDSITNMAVLPEQETVLIADADELIGLSTTGEGKIKETFRVKLEFKNKIGGGAKAMRTGMKLAGGGLMGLAKKSPEDEDPPVAIAMQENGLAVLRAKQHLLAFDPKTRQIPWSIEYAAPGRSGWANLAMLAATSFAYAVHTHRAANSYYGTSENRWANANRKKAIEDYLRYTGKRYQATQSTGQYVYILTTIEEGKEKGVGIVGVNMTTGATDRQVMFKDKDPEYEVDEVTGRVFHVKDGKSLTAYKLN